MTNLAINYLRLQEEKRSNLAREAETNRSNVARETETNRSNLATEAETNRSNTVREQETKRHNEAGETIDMIRAALPTTSAGFKTVLSNILAGGTTLEKYAPEAAAALKRDLEATLNSVVTEATDRYTLSEDTGNLADSVTGMVESVGLDTLSQAVQNYATQLPKWAPAVLATPGGALPLAMWAVARALYDKKPTLKAWFGKKKSPTKSDSGGKF